MTATVIIIHSVCSSHARRGEAIASEALRAAFGSDDEKCTKGHPTHTTRMGKQ